jgi:nitroimidazol reductase NimA-like FMN-containing flavoprotein (pyridoxamine 5'-phosphate oxidase superfamily)
MNVTGDWSAERAASFLREAVIPVRLATNTPGGGLWMLSLWYQYRDGELQCATGASADVVEYLRADDRVAFEVSTNDVPYCGARGAGRATVEPDEDKQVLRALLERYLGGSDSDLARALLAPDREEVRIHIAPERLYTWDFSDRMDDTRAGDAGPAGERAGGDRPGG